MNDVKAFFDLDFKEVVIGIFAILLVIRAFGELIGWICRKFGIELKWVKEKESDHKKLEAVCAEVELLKKNQVNEVASAASDALRLKDNITDLSKKINEIVVAINEIKSSIESLNKTTEINSATNVELLYQKINEKCDHYINDLQGIPNDEYMVLQNLFEKYTLSGGNHGLYKKVDYCLANLPIIPEKQL